MNKMKKGGNLNPGQIEDLLESLSSSKKTPSSFKTPSRSQLNNIRRTLLQPLSVHNNNVKQHPTMSRTLTKTGIENEDPSIVAVKEQDASSSDILSSPLAAPLPSSPDIQIAPPTLPALPTPTAAAATTTSTAVTTTTTTTSAANVSITTTMARTPTPITTSGASSSGAGSSGAGSSGASSGTTPAANPAATPAATPRDTTGHGTAPGFFLFSNFGPGVSQSIEENEDNFEDETDKEEIETGTKKKQVYKNPKVRRHDKEISFSTISRDSYIHDKKAYAKKCEQWSNRLKTANSKFSELQKAFDLPQNYITIVEDNMHKTGHSESKLAGRLLVSGEGPIFQNFVHNKIRYKKDAFFLLKNVNELKANRHVSDV